MSQKTVAMLLKEMGQKSVYSISADETVRRLAHLLDKWGVGALVVFTENKIVGIVSERDIVKKVVHLGRDYSTLVSDVMTTDIVSVTPHTILEECERLMKRKGFRHLPVIDQGILVAVISIRDLLVSTRLEQEQLIGYLKGYIMPGYSE